VDTVDAAITVPTADIASLDIQPGERISIRSQAHHVVALLPDDGAGTSILLRRLV
jgi:ABC-type sulfate/molybdate transport systems ATPase subunit